MVMSEGGKMVRTPASTISCGGRSTQGVRIVSLGAEDKVTAVARVLPQAEEAPAEGAPEDQPDGEAPTQ